MSEQQISFDALIPSDMAAKAEGVGVKKANLALPQMFMLAVLAGAFIAMGAIFATTVLAGGITVADPSGAAVASTALPYGWNRFLGGLAFTVGLILVVVGGAELFTGNNLITMAWANGKVTTLQLLRNWVVVYIGNFVGAILTAFIMYLSRQYTFGGGAIGKTVLSIGQSKTGLEFISAVALGIFCNALVCMAVWMCFSARSTGDKILAIIPPIAAFVAAGFEHSVANMYFIPIALFVKMDTAWIEKMKIAPETINNLTWGNFLFKNLLPVTIGNIIGGAVMVGLVYWFIYLLPKKRAAAADK
jgi:formate/nitrite transporter